MPQKQQKPTTYRFDIVKKLSRPRSYIIIRQYRMDALSILSQAVSRMLGGRA